MRDYLDDPTRSRLHRLIQKLGGGKLTLYAVAERRPTTVIVVVSTCAEEALKLIRDEVGLDWNIGNTTTRAIQRNIDAEPSIVTAFKLRHDRATAALATQPAAPQ